MGSFQNPTSSEFLNMSIQKKVCMLGSFGVGKTSLVSNFVHSIFSDEYLTTIGVKIDKKVIDINGTELQLILWDLAGDDRFDNFQATYLIGVSGYLLVVDGCRAETLAVARRIMEKNQSMLQDVPFTCLINKSDLRADWEITQSDIDALEAEGWIVLLTSAKDGHGVDDAFQNLSSRMLGNEQPLPA